MSELKPCPFCGTTDRKKHETGCFFKVYDASNAYCSPVTIGEMDRAWNQRQDGWIKFESCEDIPVSEEVLTIDDCGDIFIDYVDICSDTGFYYFVNGADPIYWMQIPQPPTTSTPPTHADD